MSVEWINVFGNPSHSDCVGYMSKRNQPENCEMFTETNWYIDVAWF